MDCASFGPFLRQEFCNYVRHELVLLVLAKQQQLRILVKFYCLMGSLSCMFPDLHYNIDFFSFDVEAEFLLLRSVGQWLGFFHLGQYFFNCFAALLIQGVLALPLSTLSFT
jgi:hypothetical protein